jgi:hypothetical protein
VIGVVRDPVGEPTTIERVNATGPELAGDDAFIFAWARCDAAGRSRARQLVISMMLNVALVALVGFLVWRNEKKETYVFVRNAFGEVVQADARSFLHAGDNRTEAEVKSFMRQWVKDAFSWTPLDVADRMTATLRVVDPKARSVVKEGLRLGERRDLVEKGMSGRLFDDPKSEKAPQAVIVRFEPLEVLVTFERYLVDASGQSIGLSPLIVRAHLRPVPRGPGNEYGLIIVNAQISQKL